MEKNSTLPSDEKVNVEISPDKMFGVIVFIQPEHEGNKLTEEEIKMAIDEKGIKYGLDEVLLKEICNERKYNYKYFIAKGKAPTIGQNASIDYQFNVEGLQKIIPTLKEDGSVDFKNLNIMSNVKIGDVIATKTSPKIGEDGYNIFGESIKGKIGKDIRMPIGKHTKVLEDGLTLVATIDGQIDYDGHSLSISPTFYVDKDVDSSTGNIDFIGNVVVEGIVHSGFSIKAKGNVEVRGYVEAAQIEADGDIILRHGIQGNEKGFLKARGNILAKFIQRSEAYASGDIIAEAILHSQVAADGEILVHKGKGTLVGGSTTAGKCIRANIVGSAMNTVTVLQIGVSKSLINNYQEILLKHNKLKEEFNQVNKNICFLQTKAKENKLPREKSDLLNQLIQARVILTNQIKKIEQDYKEKVELIKKANKGQVKVQDKIYPGTRVVIGDTTKYILQENSRCLIQKQGAEVTIGILL